MAQPSRKPDEIEQSFAETKELSTLKSQAVAIDPPPSGAIGIQELLNRFERFAEADELVGLPEDRSVGVRELLERLDDLVQAGHFSSPALDDSGEQ